MPTINGELDVEENLKKLGITMDVKITQIPNVPGKPFGPPSVELSLIDYAPFETILSENFIKELNISEELQKKIFENPLKITFSITNKLHEIVEDLKVSKNPEIKNKTDEIINYLNNKKKIYDIKTDINKFNSIVLNTPTETHNIKTILEKYQIAISSLNQMDQDAKIIPTLSVESANEIQPTEAANIINILNNYVEKFTFNIIINLLDKVKINTESNKNIKEIIGELQKKKQELPDLNSLLKKTPKSTSGGKNMKKTLQYVQKIMNDKIGGKNLVMQKLNSIRNIS